MIGFSRSPFSGRRLEIGELLLQVLGDLARELWIGGGRAVAVGPGKRAKFCWPMLCPLAASAPRGLRGGERAAQTAKLKSAQARFSLFLP